MAYKSGLFTREQAHAKKTSHVGVPEARNARHTQDLEYAVMMGADYANKQMNPKAKNPNLAPEGSSPCDVYMLRTAPDARSDKLGEAWADDMGKWLVQLTGLSLVDELRVGYICPTLPKEYDRPTHKERDMAFFTAAYNAQLVKDIEQTKPKVIVAFGGIVLGALCKPLSSYTTGTHGTLFPVQVGKHRCWLMPMPSPKMYWEMQQALDNGDTKRVKESLVYFKKYLKDLDTPPRFPKEDFTPKLNKEWVEQNVDVVYDIDKLETHFKRMRKSPYYAFDLEATGLRALWDDLGILSLAYTYLRKGKYVTFSFGWNHPEAEWIDDDRKQIYKWVVKAMQQRKQGKIAHNAVFEMMWMRAHFDPGIHLYDPSWEDTLMQAVCLNSRGRTHSLDFRCLLYFGLPLKAQSKTDVKRLRYELLDDVCKYNGLDTYWTLKVWEKQSALLGKDNQEDAYYHLIERLPFLADMHIKGFRIDQEAIHRLHDEFTQRQRDLDKALRKDMDIRKYQSKFGRINFGSSGHLTKLIQRTLGYEEESGSDLTVQKRLANKHACFGKIVEWRALNKLISTYVMPYMAEDDHTVIYPDGRVHPVYKPDGAETGRTASNDPNIQNIPNRDKNGRRVRGIFVPDIAVPRKGTKVKKKDRHVLLSSDYGQLEARVLAMASRDKVFTNALVHDLDVHMEWTEKLVEEFPHILDEQHGGDIKKMRSAIKNQLVFPWFYGASLYSVARVLTVDPDDLEDLYNEFWDTFKGVRKWQRRVTNDYQRNGYAECLTGDRRHGPLDYNAVINTPIQGSASHIVVRAGQRITKHAHEVGKPWRIPQCNVHDDMVWSVPLWDFEETMDVVTKIQVDLHYDWQKGVPLTVNPARGFTWEEMEELGEVRSTY